MQVPNEATVTVADFVAHTHRCIITSKKKSRHLSHVNKNYLKLRSSVDIDMLIQNVPLRNTLMNHTPSIIGRKLIVERSNLVSSCKKKIGNLH